MQTVIPLCVEGSQGFDVNVCSAVLLCDKKKGTREVNVRGARLNSFWKEK